MAARDATEELEAHLADGAARVQEHHLGEHEAAQAVDADVARRARPRTAIGVGVGVMP